MVGEALNEQNSQPHFLLPTDTAENNMTSICIVVLLALMSMVSPFVVPQVRPTLRPISLPPHTHTPSTTSLHLADFDQISLATSQENAGLAVVVLGEAGYSFIKAPGWKTGLLFPPALAAAYVLFTISGPPLENADITMGDGLQVAALVSLALMGVYGLRLVLPTPNKEITFGGFLLSFAGFASFSQNLFAGGWLAFPALPSLPSLPSLPF